MFSLRLLRDWRQVCRQTPTLDLILEQLQVPLVAPNEHLFAFSQAADLVSDLFGFFGRGELSDPVPWDSSPCTPPAGTGSKPRIDDGTCSGFSSVSSAGTLYSE